MQCHAYRLYDFGKQLLDLIIDSVELTYLRVPFHDQRGQKKRYVSTVAYLDIRMRRWRGEVS